MARNRRRLRCRAEAVFEVLGDGWLYPSWVVGASRMRDVDADWPAPGSRLRHSVGVWPALLDDSTSVREWDPPRRMVLTARGWPIGEAGVAITVEPRGDECVVEIREAAVSGPARLVPRFIADLLLGWRNAETLHRLAYLAEGREDRAFTSAEREEGSAQDGSAEEESAEEEGGESGGNKDPGLPASP